jgi:nucleoside-diphosphate-sugar epimerase
LLEIPSELIAGEIFNAAYQNHTISELAEMVKKIVEQEMPDKVPIKIKTTTSDDLRSYHVSSSKIRKKLGYTPGRSVEDAVRDLCHAFKDGKLPNSMTDDRYINVKVVKKKGIK